jgi:hypothetical protein
MWRKRDEREMTKVEKLLDKNGMASKFEHFQYYFHKSRDNLPPVTILLFLQLYSASSQQQSIPSSTDFCKYFFCYLIVKQLSQCFLYTAVGETRDQ